MRNRFFNEKACVMAIRVFLILLFPVSPSGLGEAHPGRTDAHGGHTNRKTGEYHFHGGAESPEPPDESEPLPPALPGTVKAPGSKALWVAAWNLRNLSDKSRSDAELLKIAETLRDYDLIAMSEVRDEIVLKRLLRHLSASGAEYGYLISDRVGKAGSRHAEHYVFLYAKELVSVVKAGEHYPDAAAGDGDFVRDPYWATFRAGQFDFSIIVVHVVWGDTVAERQAEIQALSDVWAYVDRANGAEDDILLVGDFNREPDDIHAYRNLMALPSMTHLFALPEKSHIKESSLYDNIFFQRHAVREYTGVSGIDKFDETDFGNDDDAANLAVSDHRPVWAVFRIDGVAEDSAETLALDEVPALDEAPREDVNNDGRVNIQDLVLIANAFGQSVDSNAAQNPDVNADGTVNVLDLVKVSRRFEKKVKQTTSK